MPVPGDLTLPEPGSTTARRIVGRYLRRLWQDLVQVPRGRFRSGIFDDFADTRAILERAARQGRMGLVFSILRRPTHSALLRCLHAELWGAGDPLKLDTWLAELTALIALELALVGELAGDGVRLRERPERLLSIGAGIELSCDRGLALTLRVRQAVIETPGGRTVIDLDGERSQAALAPGIALSWPYHPIAGGLVLALADNNPLASIEAHPDKRGNAVDRGGQPVERWIETLRAALALVDDHLPDLGREIREVVQVVVPVGADPERHLSASYAEAIGIAYLSLHPDPMTMAEALIHEACHNKLNALFSLEPLLENAFQPLYPSPVRPDPRPLHGVLLAVHAFVPVARLYQCLQQAGHPLAQRPGFAERARIIVEGNRTGFATLREHARPTPTGRALLDELGRWDEHFRR